MNEDLYLYHHGVKGMKWGVRKDKSRVSSRKQRKQDRRNISNAKFKIQAEERKKVHKEYGVEEKWNAAEKRAQKVYDKKGTSAIAEDKTYQKLYNDYNRSHDKAEAVVKQRTNKALVQKFGKEKVDDFLKYEKRMSNIGGAIIGGGALASVTIPPVLAAILIAKKY